VGKGDKKRESYRGRQREKWNGIEGEGKEWKSRIEGERKEEEYRDRQTWREGRIQRE
jgi:hypothetical protein